jgi:hypothetical protein
MSQSKAVTIGWMSDSMGTPWGQAELKETAGWAGYGSAI